MLLLLQEYYHPYQEQDVGYRDGHFYRNQQSYNLGEVPYAEKVKVEEETHYAFNEYQPTHYEDASPSNSDYQEHNYEIQSKQPHQESQNQLQSQFDEQSHYKDTEDQLSGEEYQFEDFESQENTVTKEKYEEEAENLGYLPPYTAAQPRSFAPYQPAFSGYQRKSTLAEGRRSWPPPGFNQYSVPPSFAGWTRKR